MSDKHTPTPWSIRKEIDGLHADWKTWICSGLVGIAVCNNQTRRSTFNASRDEAEANARFIVTACNHHAELVEALREVITDCEAYGMVTVETLNYIERLADKLEREG